MLPYAAFHLGLHCLPKYMVSGMIRVSISFPSHFQNYNGWHSHMIVTAKLSKKKRYVGYWAKTQGPVRSYQIATNRIKKIVSMIRKYHNHTLQTIPCHREEEPQNTDSHKTSGRQPKQSNQLLAHQDDCKTRKDTIISTT